MFFFHLFCCINFLHDRLLRPNRPSSLLAYSTRPQATYTTDEQPAVFSARQKTYDHPQQFVSIFLRHLKLGQPRTKEKIWGMGNSPALLISSLLCLPAAATTAALLLHENVCNSICCSHMVSVTGASFVVLLLGRVLEYRTAFHMYVILLSFLESPSYGLLFFLKCLLYLPFLLTCMFSA